MSTTAEHTRIPTVEWPTWTKIYAIVVGAPMASLSLGLALWIMLTRFGGTFDDRPWQAMLILLTVFPLTFAVAAWMFYVGVKRIMENLVEALVFAASGHLMVALPAMLLTFARFLQDQPRFLRELGEGVSADLGLMTWMALNIYAALILALADNTGDQ